MCRGIGGGNFTAPVSDWVWGGLCGSESRGGQPTARAINGLGPLGHVPVGCWALRVLILRRAVIGEQGKPPPFVPAAHARRRGHTHVGLIWGPVMRRGVFLPTSFTQNGGRWRRCYLP